MKLHYTKRYLRSFRRLQRDDQESVAEAMTLFQDNPFHPILRNHQLQGKMRGLRAIAAGFDIRILYREEGHHSIVFLLQTGTHDQVY
ncbi:type II toxin-antitoxin system mRNA interferase toxin, RelE/StbE family [Candidatus Peregrinibacteria bacterium]|nr:type II toxin-antitoxin system mRNA interferase toxin, RelE/StbE family [Candidatus Peregrinibacteria bacterium]